MKKSLILLFVLVIAALSVLSVSAAPHNRYYDQLGNKHWCNVDSYGCWVTGENGEHEYIMFWSEAARDSIMGPDSKAPLGTNPGTSELGLLPPKPAAAAPTAVPTAAPTAVPTAVPIVVPTAVPTAAPTAVPTAAPTAVPTAAPTATSAPLYDCWSLDEAACNATDGYCIWRYDYNECQG